MLGLAPLPPGDHRQHETDSPNVKGGFVEKFRAETIIDPFAPQELLDGWDDEVGRAGGIPIQVIHRTVGKPVLGVQVEIREHRQSDQDDCQQPKSQHALPKYFVPEAFIALEDQEANQENPGHNDRHVNIVRAGQTDQASGNGSQQHRLPGKLVLFEQIEQAPEIKREPLRSGQAQMTGDVMGHFERDECKNGPGNQACHLALGQVPHPQIHPQAGQNKAGQHSKVVAPGGSEEQAARQG